MSVDEYQDIFVTLQKSFDSGKTCEIQWRKDQLKSLCNMLSTHEGEFCEAIGKDLGKSDFESWSTEIQLVISEARYAIRKLSKWARAKRVRVPFFLFRSSAKIVPQPLGVVLIIGAWNYPLQLVLSPLVGSLAAGCCSLVKPSEYCQATSKLLAELLPRYLDNDCVKVVEGGIDETSALLELPWNKIFFTGSTAVGKIIMAEASRNLIPVTLELGGKSPCVVDSSADLKIAAQRIVFGKFLNAGQTCVAPDYILAEDAIFDALVEQLKKTIFEFYGENPYESGDYSRIVNAKHYERLCKYFKDGKVACGGVTKADSLYISPTVLVDVDEDSTVMQEEIFGPILPVISVADIDNAIDFINRREKPLAAYIFSNDKHCVKSFLSRTISGGACVNETVLHFTLPQLPFGGVGISGMGQYHGKYSFEAFSHYKSILNHKKFPNISLHHPPITPGKVRLLRKILG